MYGDAFPIDAEDLTLWNQNVGKLCCPLHRRGDFLSCIVSEPAALKDVSSAGQTPVAQWWCSNCFATAPVRIDEVLEALGMLRTARRSTLLVDQSLDALPAHPARTLDGALRVRWHQARRSWFGRRGAPAIGFTSLTAKHAAVVQPGDWVLASSVAGPDVDHRTVQWDHLNDRDDQSAVRVTRCLRQGNTEALVIETTGGTAVVHDDTLLAVITDGLTDPTLVDRTWFIPIPSTLPRASDFPPARP